MSIKKRVMFVFGTRPEAIKLAPVINEVKKHPDVFELLIVVTGQHRHMLDQVLRVFDIKPDYDMGIMEEGQTIQNVVSKVLRGLEGIILREKPDIVLVQGDTSTAFAASLSAFYRKVPVGHVEAGLRTWDKYRPFPEEMNRKLTTSLADIHFAPTSTSVKNLKNEGVPLVSIYLTGNTVIDALFDVAKKDFDLRRVGLDLTAGKKVVLVTTHRRESFGQPLKAICSAIRQIAQKHLDDAKLVIPVHKNPSVRDVVFDELSGLKNVELIEPLEYEPFVHLMKASYLILTDSGGIQEEAPSLGKPVLVLREVTERPEGVNAGVVKLVGVKTESIIDACEKLLSDRSEYDKMACKKNPYGDGLASQRVVSALLHYFGMIDRRPIEFSFS